MVAERHGQTAVRNILGHNKSFDAVPFFWSQHYDVAIRYVGHAERWDRIEIEGDPALRDCTVGYFQGNRRLAVATVSRDLANLRAEVELERDRVLKMPYELHYKPRRAVKRHGAHVIGQVGE